VLEPQLRPLAAAYVLAMVVLGPTLARVIEPLIARVSGWRRVSLRRSYGGR